MTAAAIRRRPATVGQRTRPLAGGSRPDGLSWSPYLAIGLTVLFGFGALILSLWDRRRR
ncbi:hypothetical protein [Streptomyces sp. NPDC058305]|uniref:hypothetical protein n=1 Tax=Streptomyces sp. NPDC058305 TaxID=3346438 RepID=UPI0036E7C341